MSRKLLNVLQLWFTIFFAYIMATTVWQVLGWKIFPLVYLFFVGEIVWTNWSADLVLYKDFVIKLATYFVTPFKSLVIIIEMGLAAIFGVLVAMKAKRNGSLRPGTAQANQR